MIQAPIHIIPATPLHDSIVFSWWCEALWHVTPYRRLPRGWFSAAHGALARQIISHPSTVTAIAVDGNDPDTWVGFACGDPERRLLHWIGVKGLWLGHRVATRLMEHLFVEPGEEIATTVSTPHLKRLHRWNLSPQPWRLAELTR